MPQYTAGKYIKNEAALHAALHAKYPDIADFNIRVGSYVL